MWTFLDKFLGLEWLGEVAKKLNGNKTMLGLVAIVLHMLNVVPTYLPAYGFTVDIAKFLQEALLWAGVMLPWGAAHKGVKLLTRK